MNLREIACVVSYFVALSNCQTSFQSKEIEAKNKLFPAPIVKIIDDDALAPTVLIALFVRNKEHALPFFLKTLFDLEYPKERITIR